MSGSCDDDTTPRPRLRWFQYSLRTLLLIMTAFAVWIGFKTDSARRQKRAVEAVRGMGGEFSYDYQAQPWASGTGTQYDYTTEPPSPESVTVSRRTVRR